MGVDIGRNTLNYCAARLLLSFPAKASTPTYLFTLTQVESEVA